MSTYHVKSVEELAKKLDECKPYDEIIWDDQKLTGGGKITKKRKVCNLRKIAVSCTGPDNFSKKEELGCYSCPKFTIRSWYLLGSSSLDC